jgi:hypothetical protein
MEYINTEKRQEKEKKQNRLVVTPIITVFPEEKTFASNVLPIYTHFYQIYKFSI